MSRVLWCRHLVIKEYSYELSLLSGNHPQLWHVRAPRSDEFHPFPLVSRRNWRPVPKSAMYRVCSCGYIKVKRLPPEVKHTWYNDPQNASSLHSSALSEWQSNKSDGVWQRVMFQFSYILVPTVCCDPSYHLQDHCCYFFWHRYFYTIMPFIFISGKNRALSIGCTIWYLKK